jgi:metal-responsive CopG/Arc/MetJ family transcriptional regulator
MESIMVKTQITVTIEQKTLKRVDELVKNQFLGFKASRSQVVEYFVNKCLKEVPEIHVVIS